MNIGRLQHYASIQTGTSTSSGTTFAEARKQWLEITPIGASKLVFLSAQGSKVTHLITGREKPALAVGQRVVYGGLNYQITSVQTFIGERQEAQAELLQ